MNTFFSDSGYDHFGISPIGGIVIFLIIIGLAWLVATSLV